ncbi:dynactin subunit 3-like [Asterias rubens]|uniref:dynactin subunit 3-like n=1 Tax=Asterias rubens TaxID=7604 RepID=UPI0014558DE3|nr:dynactin subunit 3-like [Asterias rubens]
MATTSDVLKVLDTRIQILEELIYSKDSSVKTESSTLKVVDSLSSVKQSLSGLATGKERIQALWKITDELNSNLTPEAVSKLALTENAKADIILAEEDQLKSLTVLLEKMKGMTDVLDSQHTKGAPAVQEKLQPLTVIQLSQQERADQQSQETKQLLESYNNIVLLLSQQFVQWDAVMTRYEIAAKVREPNEY